MVVKLTRKVIAYKLRAGLVSLSVFLVLAGGVGFVAYRFWFPHYLFLTDGGLEGLRLVYAVDFVLGPLMALVFFHPEKSRGKLIFDIVVVATLQLGAMGWGAWQVWSQRPVAVVYGSERFISVAPGIMNLQYETPATLQRFSEEHPPYVYRREPVDKAEKQRMTVMIFSAGFHTESQAWLFRPYRENLASIFTHQAGFHNFIRAEQAAPWAEWVAGRATQDLAAYRFAFFEGRYSNALLVFSASGGYLGWLPLGEEPLPVVVDPTPAAGKGGATS